GAVVGGLMPVEGCGETPAWKKNALPRRNAAKGLFQVAGFACKHEWRERRKPLLDRGQRRLVGIFGHLGDRLAAPTVARPTLGHEGPPLRLSPGTGEIFQFRDLIHEGRRRKPDAIAAQIERPRYSAASRRWL